MSADAGETADGQFVLDLDGYGGPLDLLLQLARDRRIDLAQLSITTLADQYIAFIDRARHLRLEIAADYLVMAAWLAYLKSRLLLPARPPDEDDDEPAAEELARALAFQLRQLDAIRGAGAALLSRPRLGSAVLARGAGESFASHGEIVVELSLHQLLAAYGTCRKQSAAPALYQVAPLTLDSIEHALARLSGLVGSLPGWSVLSRFLPAQAPTPLHRRAQMAAVFGASLELVKRGDVQLRQERPFAPIAIRDAVPSEQAAHG